MEDISDFVTGTGRRLGDRHLGMITVRIMEDDGRRRIWADVA
jgi:hypothetical protein